MSIARTTLAAALLANLLWLCACSMTTPASSASASMAVTAQLTGASEVPPPLATRGSGSVEGTMDGRTQLLRWTVTYTGLSGPVTAAHFHGPSLVGQNAAVVLPIEGNLASPIKGEATLSAAQAADLMAGRWYVNLHTAANPNGEVRGQVAVLQ
jgi:hypothetical protein